MSAEWLRLFFEIFLAFCALASAGFSWWQGQRQATRAEITKLWEEVSTVENNRSRSVGELRDRMAEIESTQKHMPSAHDVTRLMAQVEAIQETLQGVSRQTQLINEYLLREKR